MELSYIINQQINAAVENTEESPLKVSNTRLFNYIFSNKRIVGFNGATRFAVDTDNKVYRSTDGGKTWSQRSTLSGTVARCGGIYNGTALLLWMENGDLLRSTDGGANFSAVLTGINPPVTPNGIARSMHTGAQIMFVEYTTSNSTAVLNTYFSTNSGETWTAVITKTHPADTWHFHSCDWIPGITGEDEWIVTCGDNGTDVQWYRSTNGTTWEQIYNGIAHNRKNTDQIFRTLGVRRIAPRTYIWATDTTLQTYICACDSDNLTADNVYKVLPLSAQAWGIRGGTDGMLVTADKVEASTYSGRYTNRVFVSPDSGGTWYKEYEFEAGASIDGIWGITGPSNIGEYFITVNSPEAGSIIMTPVKMEHIPMAVISNATKDVMQTIIAASVDTPTNVSSTWGSKLADTIKNPTIIVKNGSDTTVVMTMRDTSGLLLAIDGQKNSEDIASGDNVVIKYGDKYSVNEILKGWSVGVRAKTTAATTGTVTIEIIGTVTKPVDFRAM